MNMQQGVSPVRPPCEGSVNVGNRNVELVRQRPKKLLKWCTRARMLRWEFMFEAVAEWVRTHQGERESLNVRYPMQKSKDKDEKKLAIWLNNQRRKCGRVVNESKREMLESLPGWTWPMRNTTTAKRPAQVAHLKSVEKKPRLEGSDTEIEWQAKNGQEKKDEEEEKEGVPELFGPHPRLRLFTNRCKCPNFLIPGDVEMLPPRASAKVLAPGVHQGILQAAKAKGLHAMAAPRFLGVVPKGLLLAVLLGLQVLPSPFPRRRIAE